MEPTSKSAEFAAKICDKCVRLWLNDGRELLALLIGVDKSGSLFLQDCLEKVDLNAETGFVHDILSPTFLQLPFDKAHSSGFQINEGKPVHRFAYLGNYAIDLKHLKRIAIDKKAQHFLNQCVDMIKEETYREGYEKWESARDQHLESWMNEHKKVCQQRIEETLEKNQISLPNEV